MYKLIKDELKYHKSVILGEQIIQVSGNQTLEATNIMSDTVISEIITAGSREIILFTCDEQSNIYKESLKHRVNIIRNDYFNKGFYVCDHFGTPLNIVVDEKRMMIFGKNFNRIFWSYIIKYLMQIWALKNNTIFTKCSAFEFEKSGNILIGCSGSGKTTFNTHMCNSYAKFITNSNAYIRDGMIMGIASKVRIRINRNTYLWQKHINENGLSEGEFLIDPCKEFDSHCNQWIPIKNVILVNYHDGNNQIERISADIAYYYAQQFMLGLNVYRLEEDVLNYYSNNLQLASMQYKKMLVQLKDTIENCNCYYADVDITKPEVQKNIIDKL